MTTLAEVILGSIVALVLWSVLRDLWQAFRPPPPPTRDELLAMRRRRAHEREER